MEDFAGKYRRNENESNRKRQNSELRRSSRLSCKKVEKHQILLSETIEQNDAPSITTLYNLPLDLLDIILQRAYLHWILNSSTNQRDEEVIRSLISVDVCFYRRITRQRLKKAIWRYLKESHRQTKKRYAITRDNRNYLIENIQPNDEFITSLLSLNCITEEQSHLIQRQRLERDKNDELLYVMTSFDEAKWSNFVKCLRQTSQKTVARIMENGGVTLSTISSMETKLTDQMESWLTSEERNCRLDFTSEKCVIKLQMQTRGAKCTAAMESQLLHTKIEDLRNRTKPWSYQTNKLISQLSEEDIEILNSQMDRLTVVVWIWCRSQAAIEHIQSLYESNQLRAVFFESMQPSISMVINIDGNQFKKNVVVCPISIKFTRKIKFRGNEEVYGVTKLRNKIYVLCRSSSSFQTVIRVHQDRKPFRLQNKIKLTECYFTYDIGSSEKENCLYVVDSNAFCVWKITRETGVQHKIIKWLTIDNKPRTLSVPNDGQLLIVSESSSILMIYGSDAELLRSIQLPEDIGTPIHAVETSIGNFIIIHSWKVREKTGDSGSSGRVEVAKYGISELTRDGQMVIRSFSPSNETQELYYLGYLSLDSDDQLFVADYGNDRVILLDSDLKWNLILYPTKEEKEEAKQQIPWRLYYDEEKKQLIVGGFLGEEINVYSLSLK